MFVAVGIGISGPGAIYAALVGETAFTAKQLTTLYDRTQQYSGAISQGQQSALLYYTIVSNNYKRYNYRRFFAQSYGDFIILDELNNKQVSELRFIESNYLQDVYIDKYIPTLQSYVYLKRDIYKQQNPGMFSKTFYLDDAKDIIFSTKKDIKNRIDSLEKSKDITPCVLSDYIFSTEEESEIFNITNKKIPCSSSVSLPKNFVQGLGFKFNP